MHMIIVPTLFMSMRKREVAWKESPYLCIAFNIETGKNNNNSTTVVQLSTE